MLASLTLIILFEAAGDCLQRVLGRRRTRNRDGTVLALDETAGASSGLAMGLGGLFTAVLLPLLYRFFGQSG